MPRSLGAQDAAGRPDNPSKSSLRARSRIARIQGFAEPQGVPDGSGGVRGRIGWTEAGQGSSSVGKTLVYHALEEEFMLIIAGYLEVAPDRRDEFVAAHHDLLRRGRAAPGCLDLAISADAIDPARVNNFELWESREHLDAWRKVAGAPRTGIAIVRDQNDGVPRARRAAAVRVRAGST